MKKIFLACLSSLMLSSICYGQGQKMDPVFAFNTDEEVYDVSVSIAQDFIQFINNLYPDLEFGPKVVIRPTPSLSYYDAKNDAITATWWGQLPPDGKAFFFSLTDNDPQIIEQEFGMLFNWFYIPHELAHALQVKTGRTYKSRPERDWWQLELEANEMAFAYHRSKGNEKALEGLYQYAKKILSVMPNPVPEGYDIIEFFNENYPSENNPINPAVYGYLQMKQKVLIFENPERPSFEAYLQDFFER